jgi:hypothetical protein
MEYPEGRFATGVGSMVSGFQEEFAKAPWWSNCAEIDRGSFVANWVFTADDSAKEGST